MNEITGLKKYRKINRNNGIGCGSTITPPMEKMGIFSGESIFLPLFE